MKKMKKFLGALAVAATVFSLVIPMEMTVQAKPAPYTDKTPYQIRVFTGKQGIFKDDGSTVKEYKVGDSFDLGSIKVKTEFDEENKEYQKYYVKGIKPSGSDRDDLANTSFTDVDCDMDYVVVYGVSNENMVSYTVEYLDQNGNPMPQVESKSYRGKIGDKPIVPYVYIEGYTPQAYNLTKTLRGAEERPEGNVFTFYYTPVPVVGGGSHTVYDEETVTTTNPITQVVPTENTGAEGGAAAGGGGVTVVPGEGGDAQAEAGGAAAGEEAANAEETPAEPETLIDLDDEEVPLANIPGSNGNVAGSEAGSFFVSMPPAVIVGVVSLAVLVIAAAWYLLFMRKKRTNAGNDEE